MPIQVGQLNTLTILRTSPHGAYVGNSREDELLLPKKYLPQDYQEGDEIEVFVYTDSEDRPVAVTDKPYAMVGEFAALRVVAITNFGYFLDWGLEKDLFVPKAELPKNPVPKDEFMFVRIAVDNLTNRVIGIGKLGAFLANPDEKVALQEDQEVSVLVGEETDLGYRCLVENNYWGILYHNEIFGQTIKQGVHINAFVRKIREDNRIDLRLRKDGFDGIADQSELIMQKLETENGFLPISDKSTPEEIQAYFPMSKKTFKKLIGNLYKQKRIEIKKEGIQKI